MPCSDISGGMRSFSVFLAVVAYYCRLRLYCYQGSHAGLVFSLLLPVGVDPLGGGATRGEEGRHLGAVDQHPLQQLEGVAVSFWQQRGVDGGQHLLLGVPLPVCRESNGLLD